MILLVHLISFHLLQLLPAHHQLLLHVCPSASAQLAKFLGIILCGAPYLLLPDEAYVAGAHPCTTQVLAKEETQKS